MSNSWQRAFAKSYPVMPVGNTVEVAIAGPTGTMTRKIIIHGSNQTSWLDEFTDIKGTRDLWYRVLPRTAGYPDIDGIPIKYRIFDKSPQVNSIFDLIGKPAKPQGTKKTLFHATTPAKAKKYGECKAIHGPVRGFTTLQGAMAWAIKVGRTVIYQIECDDAHKLPDHHNKFGDAWWNDGNVTVFKCVFSADSDA